MDRDLCLNCDHWREEHYGVTGEWQGQLWGCAEYQGGDPGEARRSAKPDELRASRERVRQIKADRAAAFYAGIEGGE